jgi:RimJ/RimL family protein N-acetyltransferase
MAERRVRFRPTVAADLAHVSSGQKLPHRIRAVTAELDGTVIGVGGLGYRPDGVAIAFADISETLRRHPVAVHRAGRLGMDLIRRSGVPFVIAEAQPGNPAAERWLRYFGFEPTEIGDRKVFVWRRECSG